MGVANLKVRAASAWRDLEVLAPVPRNPALSNVGLPRLHVEEGKETKNDDFATVRALPVGLRAASRVRLVVWLLRGSSNPLPDSAIDSAPHHLRHLFPIGKPSYR